MKATTELTVEDCNGNIRRENINPDDQPSRKRRKRQTADEQTESLTEGEGRHLTVEQVEEQTGSLTLTDEQPEEQTEIQTEQQSGDLSDSDKPDEQTERNDEHPDEQTTENDNQKRDEQSEQSEQPDRMNSCSDKMLTEVSENSRVTENLMETVLVTQPEKILPILVHPSKQLCIFSFLTNTKFLQLNNRSSTTKSKPKRVKSGRVGKHNCNTIKGYFHSVKGNLEQFEETAINGDAHLTPHLETDTQSLTVEDQSCKSTEAGSERRE